MELSRWNRWKCKLKFATSGSRRNMLKNLSTHQSSSSSSSDDIEPLENIDSCWPLYGHHNNNVVSPSSSTASFNPLAVSGNNNNNGHKLAKPSSCDKTAKIAKIGIDLTVSYGSSGGGSSDNESLPSPTSESVNLGPSEQKLAKPSDFEFLKVIGHGNFGKVLIARHKSEGSIYAVKVLQKKVILKKNQRSKVMCERNVLLKNLDHPFLVGLHYSFQSRDKLYFVLDYVNGGELFFHLQREKYFSEPRARFYAAEITCALGYLHSQGIVYRDLKPENILLDSDGHIVLTDFGLCKDGLRDTRDTTDTFCGTPEYLAPEVLRKEAYDRRVDWWCLGVVLYEMLYGLVSIYVAYHIDKKGFFYFVRLQNIPYHIL